MGFFALVLVDLISRSRGLFRGDAHGRRSGRSLPISARHIRSAWRGLGIPVEASPTRPPGTACT